MGGSNPFVFLIDTLFSLYIGALLLRFLLQVVRADFYNPISQFLVKITSPLLVPLRRLIPSIRGLDTASLLLIVGFIIFKFFLIGLIVHYPMQPTALLLYATLELINLTLSVFFYSIIFQAILSWFQTGNYNPMQGILHSLNEPLLRPVRQIIPTISGFDLSPIVVLLGISFVRQSINYFF